MTVSCQTALEAIRHGPTTSWPPLCMSQVSSGLAGPKLAMAVTVLVSVTVTPTESVTVAMTLPCGAGDLSVGECIF